MSKSLQRIAWLIAIVGFVVGSIGIYQRVTLGHTAANYGSYIPWGLWVAAYVYFIGLSAGAFLFSTLTYVFRIDSLARIGKLALWTAMVTLIAAMSLIWLDLGHPNRVWRLLFSTNFQSVMGWMAWLYTAYFLLLIALLWLAMRADMVACSGNPGAKGTLCRVLSLGRTELSDEAMRRDRQWLRYLGALGLPLAIAFEGAAGALFGVAGARPFWHGGLTPVSFLVGALLSGGALLTFIVAIWGPDRDTEAHRGLVARLGQVVLGLLALELLLEWAEYSIGLYSAVPSEAESIRMILFGDFWWVFWLVHLLLGAVVPLLLLVFRGRSPTAVATACALIGITFLSVRLNIVLPGLAIEELQGLRAAFFGPGLNFVYFPSTMEWLVLIWAVSLAGLLFLSGYSLLPIVRPKEVA